MFMDEPLAGRLNRQMPDKTVSKMHMRCNPDLFAHPACGFSPNGKSFACQRTGPVDTLWE
jgi:hypothetical protein